MQEMLHLNSDPEACKNACCLTPKLFTQYYYSDTINLKKS